MDTQIATRKTHDGKRVALWSNGAITGGMGSGIKGIPIARPRDEKSKQTALKTGWLFIGEVELYDYKELPDLYKAAKSVARKGGRPGDVRDAMGRMGKRRQTSAPATGPGFTSDVSHPRLKMKPIWTVLRADRDGKPTERYWRLPRIRWPGMAVWDHVNRGGSRGRYEIVNIDRHGTTTSTGIRFKKLSDVMDHLQAVGVRSVSEQLEAALFSRP